jgi:hypothetical protein
MSNAIPWYQSKVYIGAVVALISQLLVLIGKQDLVPVEVITTNVEAVFQIIALVATGYAAWKRQKSDVQPLTFTKGGEKTEEGGFAHIALLIALAVLSIGILSACATKPTDVLRDPCATESDYRAERCVKAIAETWEIYQKRAEELVTSMTTPEDVKRSIQKAEASTRPIIISTLNAAAVVAQIKADLRAGTTTEEQLVIANTKLEEWVRKALPVLAEMKAAVDR